MKFDTDLSKSPVYVDEKMLKRLGACSMAREEFRDLFGKGAKVPVTRRNWVALGQTTGFLDAAWLGSRFLGDADAGVSFTKYIEDNTGKSFAEIQWPYVRRALKAKYPEFYAKAAK